MATWNGHQARGFILYPDLAKIPLLSLFGKEAVLKSLI